MIETYNKVFDEGLVTSDADREAARSARFLCPAPARGLASILFASALWLLSARAERSHHHLGHALCGAVACCCTHRLAKDLEIKAKLEEEAKAKAEAAAAENKVPLPTVRACEIIGMLPCCREIGSCCLSARRPRVRTLGVRVHGMVRAYMCV